MSTIHAKPVKVFSRDLPCTKIDILNCFHGPEGYRPRPTVETRGEIGENAPKYLSKKGYMRTYQRNWVDYQELSETGKRWLEDGIKSLLRREPGELRKIAHLPVGLRQDAPASAPRRILRTKP